ALAGHEPGHVEFNGKGELTQVGERETPSGGYEMARRVVTPESPWSRQLYLDKDGKYYTLEAVGKKEGTKRNIYERKHFPNNEVPASMRLGQAKYERLQMLTRLR